MRSPCTRSLEYLRNNGWPLVQVVEQWIPQARKRRDLFGFCDILAMHPEWGHLYVQTTSGSNVSARLKKIRESEAAGIILENSNSAIEIHGWRKVVRNGRRVWRPRILSVGISEYYNVEKTDWQIAEMIIGDLYKELRPSYKKDNIECAVYIMPFPPRIYMQMGIVRSGDIETPKLTRAEKAAMADMAVEIAGESLNKHEWLTIRKLYLEEDNDYEYTYCLKPRSYQELVERWKTNAQLAS